MNSAMSIPSLLLACAMFSAALVPAMAQTYPNKSVRLVVPFPAGSATDQVARLTGVQLQEAFGQSFVVDTVPRVHRFRSQC